MPSPTRALRSSLRSLVLGLLLAAGLAAAGFFLGRSVTQADKGHLDAAVLESQLEQVSELTTVQYHYTNMAQFQDSNDFYGVTIPFTTKKFILTYDGTIHAGVDLKEAQVSVQGDTITLTLPAARILAHDIDADSVQIFDEKTSLFNPFTVEDFTAFQADQQAVMEEKALEKGLLQQAEQQAESSLRSFLAPLLPQGGRVVVEFGG